MIDLSYFINMAAAAFIGTVGLVYRNDKQRIDERFNKLETKVDDTVSKHDMRIILDDKLDPLKEDITEIKATVNNLRDRS